MPRCRACPFVLAEEARRLRELLAGSDDVPAHLAGVPRCLHKYEPLLRDSATRLPVANADVSA